jgi:hypothetical protein
MPLPHPEWPNYLAVEGIFESKRGEQLYLPVVDSPNAFNGGLTVNFIYLPNEIEERLIEEIFGYSYVGRVPCAPDVACVYWNSLTRSSWVVVCPTIDIRTMGDSFYYLIKIAQIYCENLQIVEDTRLNLLEQEAIEIVGCHLKRRVTL